MKHKSHFPGQTIVEFALVIPVVLLLILGFFDLGRALINYSALTNAVREGTRSGIVMAYDEAAIKDKVLEYAFTLTGTSNPLTADQIVPSITSTDGFAESLQITATYCFVPVTPMIGTLIGSGCAGGGTGIELTATSIMQYEPGAR